MRQNSQGKRFEAIDIIDPEIEKLIGLSDYVLSETIGAGKYVLYDKIARRKVLLKTGDSARLENEAALLEKFRGAGVPRLYFCLSRDGKAVLMREYIEGETLRKAVSDNGCFSQYKAAKIGADICRVLNRLHSAQPPVIHRDIKTENVVLTPSGEVYIIDFDISREYNEISSRDTYVFGTPETSPPEQFGYSQTDKRSDIYAVGILLCEIYSGSIKPDNAKLKGKLGKIIRRCTGFSPDSRYKSADELVSALDQIALRKSKTKKALAIAASAVLCFSLGSGVALIGQNITKNAISENNVLSADNVYDFSDPGMEKLVRIILNKPTGNITIGDLNEITSITIAGDNHFCSWNTTLTHGNEITVDGTLVGSYGDIVSLEDIKYMPNLSTLMLCNQRISDISPISSSNIVELSLHGNSISDLSALSDCLSLRKLSISANPVSDISPLTSLPALSELDLGATDITSIDDCLKMRSLTKLQLEDCRALEDFSALGNMNYLLYLSIRPCSDETFDMIAELTNLRSLFVWEAACLTSLEQLSKLTELTYLGVDACRLSSLEGVEKFDKLDSLAFRYNYVTDLSPLKKLPSLKYLAINDNPITDLEPINDMQSLISLSIEASQLDMTNVVREDIDITIEDS